MTLIEEYQAELTELEKMYHALTDEIGAHFNAGKIAKEVQLAIVELSRKIADEEAEQEAKPYEREYDKYDKLDY